MGTVIRAHNLSRPEHTANASETARVKREVRKYLRKWTKILGLDKSDWRIKVTFNRYDHKGNSLPTAYAITDRDYYYHDVNFNPDWMIDEDTNPDTEETVLHELVHVIPHASWANTHFLVEALASSLKLDETQKETFEGLLNKFARIAGENATTSITYALLRAHGVDTPTGLIFYEQEEGRAPGPAEDRQANQDS